MILASHLASILLWLPSTWQTTSLKVSTKVFAYLGMRYYGLVAEGDKNSCTDPPPVTMSRSAILLCPFDGEERTCIRRVLGLLS